MLLGKKKISWSTIIWQGVLYALIWWILTDGALSSWWVGGPVVLLAVASGSALLVPVSFVWYEVLRFVPFFLWRSLLGGVDVAWRVMHPRLPIAPDLIEYPLQLPPGLPRVLMANIVSLLPGTLSAALNDTLLTVHVLDSRNDNRAELSAVEQGVARIFNAPLTRSQGDT